MGGREQCPRRQTGREPEQTALSPHRSRQPPPSPLPFRKPSQEINRELRRWQTPAWKFKPKPRRLAQDSRGGDGRGSLQRTVKACRRHAPALGKEVRGVRMRPGGSQPACSGGACSTPQQEASEQGSPGHNLVVCSAAASTSPPIPPPGTGDRGNRNVEEASPQDQELRRACMDTEAGPGFTAWVQAHTSSLTSSVALCVCCLVNEIVLP